MRIRTEQLKKKFSREGGRRLSADEGRAMDDLVAWKEGAGSTTRGSSHDLGGGGTYNHQLIKKGRG